jgi:hypothetical protein
MKRAFKYDAAISATEFDALGVGELSRRLQHRIGKTVYATPQNGDKPQTAATLAAAKKVIEKESRVVVVLFQRLWGTGATANDAAALKTRVGKLKRKDVIVVPLDNAPIPGWLKGIVVRASGAPASSAVVDAIIAAVVAAGGSSKRQTDAAVAARAADDDKRAKARTAFLASQRALALINRELDSLSNAVLRLCQTPGTLPPGLAPEMRRTPDRYTVQLGPVGLSFSWIRGRSNSIADGQLLVIEWSGQLADASPTTESELAMPAFEHVLQAHATSPEDWHWKRTDLDLVAYTTRDLAAQCVTSVVKRLSNGKPIATNGKPATNGNGVTRPIVAAAGAR